MMHIELLPLTADKLPQFKRDMQKAFCMGVAEAFPCEETVEILPEKDIDASLAEPGAAAYQAVVAGEMVGGAIVTVHPQTQHNELAFLYVKYGTQSHGVGQAIWNALEKRYPQTKVWVTCTPYFEKRNLHFYINCCGFHAVEFYNPHHADPHFSDPQFADRAPELPGDDCMFRFEKVM